MISGIGGVWLNGPRQCALPQLERLATALRGCGFGGVDTRWQAPVGFVHARHEPADGDRFAQPKVTDNGTALLFGGRLDRRGRLRAALGHEGWRADTDADLALLAYRRWGTEFCLRLYGDFVFALWDPHAQRLLLGRDPMGVRPLFFNRDRYGLVFASRLEAILAARRMSRDFDAQWLAGYFGARIAPRHTPYRGIEAVAPGGWVAFEAQRTRSHIYWQPQARAPRSDLSDRDHEDRFARCFRRAVGDRMRTAGVLAADLSGGLDSSSIVCVASALGSHEILPVSVISDESPTADERDYVEHVERALGVVSRRFRHEDFLPYASWPPFAYDTPGGMQSIGQREAAIDRWQVSRGARVVLRGSGGDHLLWSQIDRPPGLAEQAARGQFRALVRSLHAWSAHQGRPWVELFASAVVYPLLPPGIRRRFGADAASPSPLLQRAFVRRTDLRRRLFWEHGLASGAGASSRVRLAQVISAATSAAWAYDRGPGAPEPRYPFLDRSLIELCLELPLDQLVRGEETRSIQRRAMRGILPEAVRTRRTKAAFDEVLIRALRSHGQRFTSVLQAPRVCDLGIVDGDALRRCLMRNRHGVHDQTPVLRRILDLELWLRAHDGQLLESPAAVVPTVQLASA